MKKTLIALAAVAVSTGAMAQNATIYGVIDTGYSWAKAKDATGATTADTAVGVSGTQAGSRIGFRGTEDLGGGLTAGFQYEAGVNGFDGSGLDSFGRVSQISLSGGFGRVAYGRNLLPSYNLIGAFDATGLATNQTVTNLSTLNGDEIRGNGLFYSNTFGDITANAFITTAKGGTSDARNKLSGFDLSLSYASGPLAVGFATTRNKGRFAETEEVDTGLVVGTDAVEIPALDAEDFKVTGNVIGASYDLGMVKVFFNSIRQKGTNQLTNETAKARETNIGVSAPIGDALTVMAAFGRDKNTSSAGEVSKAKDYVLGASYSLSKRTNLFAYNSRNQTPVADGTKPKTTRTTVGIRHTF